MQWRPIIGTMMLAAFAGCDNSTSVTTCADGQEASYQGKFSEAVDLLSQCLAGKDLAVDARAVALQSRAWAYFNLKQNSLAVADQENAFRLKPPAEYREFVNYSSYLRRVKRYEDSLNALRSAEEFDRKEGKASMMTQYNLGWTLYKLGRFDDAVDAFNKGIPVQPDYPFVYWQRGLAFDALGVCAAEGIGRGHRL